MKQTTTEYFQYPQAGVKNAYNVDSYMKVAEIMETIYEENPHNWPYGLSIDGHDGGVYLVKDASNKTPVGFVGWQERERGHKKVGFYSIGILPAYRGTGMAKAAVKGIIAEKQAGVDEVHALICHNNLASRKLAETLEIPVELVYN